jgi:protein pelota
VRDAFYAHLFEWSAANGHRALTDARPKFIVVHSSSGFKHALNEVLADPAVTARLVDTKAQLEVRALAHFHQLLGEDPDRAFYGYRHVMKALVEKVHCG